MPEASDEEWNSPSVLQLQLWLSYLQTSVSKPTLLLAQGDGKGSTQRVLATVSLCLPLGFVITSAVCLASRWYDSRNTSQLAILLQGTPDNRAATLQQVPVQLRGSCAIAGSEIALMRNEKPLSSRHFRDTQAGAPNLS